MVKVRILEYLEYKGISKYKFYKETGLSNGYLDKIGSISIDSILKIKEAYPEIDLNWLIIDEKHGDHPAYMVNRDENGVMYKSKADWFSKKYLEKSYQLLKAKEVIDNLNLEIKGLRLLIQTNESPQEQ